RRADERRHPRQPQRPARHGRGQPAAQHPALQGEEGAGHPAQAHHRAVRARLAARRERGAPAHGGPEMNYLKHFGLREAPFGITPDTTYFFACRAIQEAFNTLHVAAANGEGFIKITGEVGTGKTLLCRKFLGTLDGTWISAYVPNPSFEPRTLYLA